MIDKLLNFNTSKTDAESMNLNVFPFSGEPSRIEDYKCFDDNSNMEWLDGKEFLKIDWDSIEGDTEERKRLWYYFYRPYNYGRNIAPKQKEWITSIKKDIPLKQEQLTWISGLIFILTATDIWLIFTSDLIYLHIIPILLICLCFIFYAVTDKEIVKIKSDLIILEREVENLLKQQKEILRGRLTPQKVEELFWKDIKDLEEDFIKNFLLNDIEVERQKANVCYYKSQELADFFSSNNIKPPIYPVIPSWGLLQDSQAATGDTQRVTGLSLISEKIDKKIATWRQSRNSKVYFRVWFLQFLFFQEKALYSVSFYYDFILRKKFGIKKEKYLYNHISHCSYNEETLSYMVDSPMIDKIGLPKELTNNIYGNEAKTISFSTTSSSTYRCVLPDADISNGLNAWLKKKQEYYQNINPIELEALEDEEKFYMYQELQHDSSIILPLAMQAFKEIGTRIESFSIDIDSVKNNND